MPWSCWSNNLCNVIRWFDDRYAAGKDGVWTEATFVSTGGDKLGSDDDEPFILCVQRTWARRLSH